jgi:hypothetical protein
MSRATVIVGLIARRYDVADARVLITTARRKGVG